MRGGAQNWGMRMREKADPDGLDALFAVARAEARAPAPAALLERIGRDAAAHLPPARRAPRRLAAFREALGEALGGWAGLSGLATAGIVGFWLGFAPPLALEAYLDGTESADLILPAPSFDLEG